MIITARSGQVSKAGSILARWIKLEAKVKLFLCGFSLKKLAVAVNGYE